MRKIIFITLLLTNCFALFGQGLVLEKVVARVGGEDIFYSDIQELYAYALAQDPSYPQSLQCDILEKLLTTKLLVDQAKLDSILVLDPEVDAEVDRKMDYILGQMGGNEETFINFYGKTPLEHKESMREPMREQMIEGRIQQKLISTVEITPVEVIQFFENIPSDSLPFLPAEVEIAEIAINTMISDDVKQAAREKLEKVRSRIVDDGESFAELASLFSDDLGSGQNGGDLGWAKRGSYVPEFEAMAFSLEPGEISEIIETKFGYHFLELQERRGNNIRVRHILIKPEITDEDVAKTKSHLDSVANLVNMDSISFELAVRLYSSDEMQSYSNAGRLINTNTGDTFWETGQLPYQIYFAIENLEEGGISEVIEFEERGDRIFKIIQLQTKTKPHKASLETDFAKIKQYAKESKKNIYFNEWMEQKVNSTFISIEGGFKSCPNVIKYLPEGDRQIRP